MKKEKHKKTNAMRMLDTHQVTYEVMEYEWEESRGTGVHVAEELGLNPEQVFKTLVGNGSTTGPTVFCIPVAEELDLKKAARESGNKSLSLIAVKDLLGVTGYLRGGCSPVGMKKQFPTYFHDSMRFFDTVYVSAGLRGLQMEVNPKELAAVVEATFVSLTMEK